MSLCAWIPFTVLLSSGVGPSIAVPPVRVEAPPCIMLVASHAGVPPPALGRFHVTIRDIAMNPIPFSPVRLDFSGCADLFLCSDQLDPGLVVDCAARTIDAVTDANGVVTMTLLGSSNLFGFGPPSSIGPRVKIFVPAHPTYGTVAAASALDLDGMAGVGANDLSVWLTDFGSGVGWARSDYDCSGNVGANDLSLWLEAFASIWLSESCASRCP